MSVDSAPLTFIDLVTALLDETQENINNAAVKTRAKRAINTALLDMHMGTDYSFVWPERHNFVQTRPNTTHVINILSAGLNRGSTGVVLDGARVLDDFNVEAIREGGKLLMPGSEVVFEVTNVDDFADIVTFTPAFTGTDQAAGESVTYFEDEYDLAADFLRPVDATRFSSGETPIPLIGRVEFRARFPRTRTFSRPIVATIMDRGTGEMGITTGATRRIRFWRAPSEYQQIRYSYITSNRVQDTTGAIVRQQLEDDLDEPIMKARYREAILYHALSAWYRKTDDTRSREAAGQYRDFMTRALGDTEVGQSRPRLVPNRSAAMAHRRPWGPGSTGRLDINQRFDFLLDRRRR